MSNREVAPSTTTAGTESDGTVSSDAPDRSGISGSAGSTGSAGSAESGGSAEGSPGSPAAVLRTRVRQTWFSVRGRLVQFFFMALIAVATVFAVQVPAGTGAGTNTVSAGAASHGGAVAAEGSAVAAAEALVAGAPGNSFVSRELASDLGYRPGVEEDRAVNTTGDCSSPVPLPASFESACRTHDLGYDLLRVADERGEDIPATLRPAMDRQMSDLMKRSCSEEDGTSQRIRCLAAANIAWSGVALNTVRQSNGAPVEEWWFPW